MKARLRRFVGDLLGRTGQRFTELLVEHVDTVVEAAELARAAAVGEADPTETAPKVTELENEADRLRGRLIEELGRSLTTPLDREDLFRLSRGVDDVVDTLRDFAEELALFDVRGDELYVGPFDAVLEGLGALRHAVEQIAADPDEVATVAREAKHVVEIHDAYRHALAELFQRPLDVGTLKHRELLRRLDIVGQRLKEVADLLADAAHKRV